MALDPSKFSIKNLTLNPEMQVSNTGWVTPIDLDGAMSNYSATDAQMTKKMWELTQDKHPTPETNCPGPGICPMCEEDTTPNVPLVEAIPQLRNPVICPCTLPDCYKPTMEIWAVVIRLNDVAHWTREQIADWLDTLDADLRFNLPEGPETTEGQI